MNDIEWETDEKKILQKFEKYLKKKNCLHKNTVSDGDEYGYFASCTDCGEHWSS
jgi:hypothetical protein